MRSAVIRIRNIHDLTFFRPDKTTRYDHIDELFGESINWALIEKHFPDMLRVALSIKLGKLTPSTILRRLGTASRKNKLYFAFRELGKVVRTIFLLRYIHDVELRKTIHAATSNQQPATSNQQPARTKNSTASPNGPSLVKRGSSRKTFSTSSAKLLNTISSYRT